MTVTFLSIILATVAGGLFQSRKSITSTELTCNKCLLNWLLIWTKGAQWWLTPEEELELEKSNANYKAISVIQELVVTALDVSRIGDRNLPLMSAIELLRYLGIEHPKIWTVKSVPQSYAIF